MIDAKRYKALREAGAPWASGRMVSEHGIDWRHPAIVWKLESSAGVLDLSHPRAAEIADSGCWRRGESA